MDKHSVTIIIEGLKSTSSSRVQDTLQKIRSKVIGNENGIKVFTKCGGLNYLIPHLRKPNERILDLTLSILGNLCLDDDCRIAVGKLHVVGPIISVLKTVCRDSIVGRACRVIGNLAQKTSNAEDLHDQGAVPALVTLIESRDNKTSYPTLTMAVRALRQLWAVADKREEMLRVNTVKCIAILLIKECESAGILKSNTTQNGPRELRKSQEELISGILKCFGYFTTHATANCAEQIQGDGRGYHCLVALTDTFESLALRCLMNLCYLPSCRPLLGSAGLVECIVGMLKNISEVLWWPEGAARMLSQLSAESVNRAKIRHSGGLPLLIAGAREYIHALRALLQYVFDDTSFQILIKEGLIPLVNNELKKHLTSMQCEHNYKPPIHENDIEEKSVDTTNQEDTNNETTTKEGKVSLFKRRRHLSDDNKERLNVVIERDDMYVGFRDIDDNDASNSQNKEDLEDQTQRKRLKISRSKSPSPFSKRARVWGRSVYWETKCSAPSCSSRSAMSPEYGPTSPWSDGTAGLSPEHRPAARRARADCSPDSGFSTCEGSAASPASTDYPWSPTSSASPTSPFSVNDESSDSEVSGRYSPVCSEHDTEASGAGDVDAAQAAMDDLAVTDAEDDDDVDHEPFEDTENEPYNVDSHSSRIACVMVLLYRVSNGSYDGQFCHEKESVIPTNILELLTGEDCLNTLLDYVEKCRKPMGRAAHILTFIFTNSLCLKNILKQRIALRLHNMILTSKHPVSKCEQCRLLKKLCAKLLARLTVLAESSYGIGEISYQLLRGSDSMKEMLSMTLPYFVKSRPVFRKFYIECNALMVLFVAIPETTDDFRYYVTALNKLATYAQIKNPKDLENAFFEHVCMSYDKMQKYLAEDDEIVTFELDDLSTVTTNKKFLCQNSEVFNAMLMGSFKESIQESVRLKNVSKPALEYLLTLLRCGFNNNNLNIKIFPMASKLDINLEALILADRFLLDKIKAVLNSAIIQFKMTSETAEKIYIWSLNEGMGFLCVESVAYILTGKMSEMERLRVFKNILKLEYKEQWFDDIKNMIMRQLALWS